MKSVLIIGGARSGKSALAQQLAHSSVKPVLFVATAEAGDEEMRRRIEKHQKERPANWTTLEATAHVGRQIIESGGMAQTIVIDCVTLLVNNILLEYSDITGEQVDETAAEKAVLSEIEELITTINKTRASFIIVSNEVGLGLVPPNKMSRVYRDLLGRANQLLASQADEVYWMVAGIPVRIKPPDSCSNILRE